MLSPHEFATLMLVKNAQEQIDLDRADLDALLERQLVSLESLAEGRHVSLVTTHGDRVLKAVSRFRKS
ncbi:hypothetical protein [Burkholderia sp. L27(2015)]|jgi:hypothetical protein|uniref:hypothetical protein n=1 Tax=Burkholderia sp. L27(2015) TaxID=1641858 RepID=UPI00131C90F8|nr:hypothetical protein [Burkholderia sp. L27(2015)]